MKRKWVCDDCNNKLRHECTLCSGTGETKMVWDVVFGETRYVTITCEECNGKGIVKCQDCNRKWFAEHPKQLKILNSLSKGIVYIQRTDIGHCRLIPRRKDIEVSYFRDGVWSKGERSGKVLYTGIQRYLSFIGERRIIAFGRKPLAQGQPA